MPTLLNSLDFSLLRAYSPSPHLSYFLYFLLHFLLPILFLPFVYILPVLPFTMLNLSALPRAVITLLTSPKHTVYKFFSYIGFPMKGRRLQV